MDRAAAKELLHIDGWLDRSAQIVERGKDAYLADDLLQEAGEPMPGPAPGGREKVGMGSGRRRETGAGSS